MLALKVNILVQIRNAFHVLLIVNSALIKQAIAKNVKLNHLL